MKVLTHLLISLSLLLIVLFSACKTGDNFSNEDKLLYTKIGNSVVKQTFDTLSHSLQTAIAEMGVDKAVSYCLTNAYPLTDTYASDSVIIRRTSLKYRNPANKPDTTEDRILKLFASLKEKGIVNDSLKSIVEQSKNGMVHFYKPIILQPMCTSCHGKKIDDGQSSLWKTIDSLYPTDMANGYQPGDLRGIWHITFKKNQGK